MMKQLTDLQLNEACRQLALREANHGDWPNSGEIPLVFYQIWEEHYPNLCETDWFSVIERVVERNAVRRIAQLYDG